MSTVDPRAAPPVLGAGKATAKVAAFRTLADLIREAYGGKRKRLNVTKAALDAMQAGPRLEPPHREELLRLSGSDRTLERTRELMLLSAGCFGSQPLAGMMRDMVRDVLRRHPAFLGDSLAGVLENLPDALNEEAAVQIVASQSFSTLRWPEGVAPLKKKEVEQCRLNAVCCLLLWFRETRGLSIERIQRYLHAAAWEPAADRHKAEPQRLRALMQARDRAALGIACSALEKRAQEYRQEAVVARDVEARAAARATELQSEVTDVNAQLNAAKGQVEHLTAEIEKRWRENENEKAHMRAEYEELRGRVLRKLRQEVSLLDEGLHALKRQPPKIHVMQDHAERAVDGLKGEINRIKGED